MEEMVCLRNPMAERCEQMQDHAGILAYPFHYWSAGEGKKAAMADCSCGSGAEVSVNQGHLSEESAFLQKSKHNLFTIFILADLNSPGLDDIHGVALITLAEDDFSFIATDAEKIFALTHGNKYTIFVVVLFQCMNVNKLIRLNIRSLSAYQAKDIPCRVKLDANESPFGFIITQKIVKSIQTNRYPDPARLCGEFWYLFELRKKSVKRMLEDFGKNEPEGFVYPLPYKALDAVIHA